MNIFQSIGAGIASIGLFIASLFGYAPEPQPSLGVALPSGTANFETALATGISDSATSMTLTSNTVRGGGSLSGYQCFTIDEGSAQAEFVCGTASGTVVSSLERGLSPADGVTEVDALQFSHRRGASVKITDFPLIQRLVAQNSGESTFETVLQYASSVGTSTVASDGQNIASVAYTNSLSFGGVAASAGTAVSGFVELATGEESASSTLAGSTGATLALHTGISTSSAPSSGNVVVVTGDDGNIDYGFIPNFVGSSTIRVYTASTTYTKPALLKRIVLEVQGAGGDGGTDGAGGGGGAYLKKVIDASQLTATTSIVIGGAGIGTGNTSFGIYIAGNGADASTVTGGAGGTATLGDVNVNGQSGISSPTSNGGGQGGSSYFGSGGGYVYNLNTGAVLNGQAGTGYGAGGSGGQSGSDGSPSGSPGGAGTQGIVIITEYF